MFSPFLEEREVGYNTCSSGAGEAAFLRVDRELTREAPLQGLHGDPFFIDWFERH